MPVRIHFPRRAPAEGEVYPRREYSRFSKGGERHQSRYLSVRSKEDWIGRARPSYWSDNGETRTAASTDLHQYFHQPLAGHDSRASVGLVMMETHGARNSTISRARSEGHRHAGGMCLLNISIALGKSVISEGDFPLKSAVGQAVVANSGCPRHHGQFPGSRVVTPRDMLVASPAIPEPII